MFGYRKVDSKRARQFDQGVRMIIRDMFNNRFPCIKPFMSLGSLSSAELRRSRFLNQCQSEKRR